MVKTRPLNNVERLVEKRGVSVIFIWDIDHHKYRDASGLHYIPYNIGSNEAKRLRRQQYGRKRHGRKY
jgi:hypothetical protein